MEMEGTLRSPIPAQGRNIPVQTISDRLQKIIQAIKIQTKSSPVHKLDCPGSATENQRMLGPFTL